jgi:hypothetical protein
LNCFEWGLLSRATRGGEAERQCRVRLEEKVSCLAPIVRRQLLEPASNGDAWEVAPLLGKDSLFVWSEWDKRAPCSPEESSRLLRAAAEAAEARRPVWEHTAAAQLARLDVYRNGGPVRALAALRSGRVVAAGLLISSLLENFVKRHLPLQWFEGAHSVPHRIAQLCSDARFLQLPAGFRFWFAAVVAPAPEGLNLRNILWHGFGSTDFAPRLVWLLFSFALSVAGLLGEPQIELEIDVEPILRKTGASFVCGAVDWRSAVRESFFVFPGMQGLLLEGESDSADMHLCTLCAVIEQSLRQVFAHASCSKAVILTATDSLMTTMDYFIDGGGAAFDELIGTSALEELRDLFALQNGPKIRDLLSHGACDAARLPLRLVNCLHRLLLRLLLRFRIGGARVVVPEYTACLSEAALCRTAVRRCADLIESLRDRCESPFPFPPPKVPDSSVLTTPVRCAALLRCAAQLTDIAFMLLQKDFNPASFASVVAVLCVLFAAPNDVLASVVKTYLKKNAVSRIVGFVSVFVGLPVDQGSLSKRERALFENKFAACAVVPVSAEQCRALFVTACKLNEKL